MSGSDNFVEQIQREQDAEDLACDITKQCEKYGVRIGISNIRALPDRIIMEVKLKGNTRKAHLQANIPDVKLKLRLPILYVQQYKYRLYIIASRKEIMYEHLPKLLCVMAYKKSSQKMLLPYWVGYDVFGNPIVIDLATQPHLLMGGSTNAGKSVGEQTLIGSISYNVSPQEVNFVLIDLGANDLTPLGDLPHLACPVVRSQGRAIEVLTAVVAEMERRKDLELTNKQEFDALPRLVLVIDEFPALFHCAGNKHISNSLRDMISSLLQRGRHSKIHVVLAAQNPTYQNMKVDLGNVTTRIAFRCAKKNYSEIILGEGGAEKLIESGDLLLKATNFDGLQQIRGLYATPKELEQLVQTIADKWYGKRANRLAIYSSERGKSLDYGKIVAQTSPDDRFLATVMLWAISRDAISVNLIQRNFKIGWYKAAKLVKQLESMGLVGQPISKLPRYVTPISYGDIPTDMLEFLRRNGVTDEAVKLAISDRYGKTNELAPGQPHGVSSHSIGENPLATQDLLRDNDLGAKHAKKRCAISPKRKSRPSASGGEHPKEINKIIKQLGKDRNKR